MLMQFIQKAMAEPKRLQEAWNRIPFVRKVTGGVNAIHCTCDTCALLRDLKTEFEK